MFSTCYYAKNNQMLNIKVQEKFMLFITKGGITINAHNQMSNIEV